MSIAEPLAKGMDMDTWHIWTSIIYVRLEYHCKCNRVQSRQAVPCPWVSAVLGAITTREMEEEIISLLWARDYPRIEADTATYI